MRSPYGDFPPDHGTPDRAPRCASFVTGSLGDIDTGSSTVVDAVPAGLDGRRQAMILPAQRDRSAVRARVPSFSGPVTLDLVGPLVWTRPGEQHSRAARPLPRVRSGGPRATAGTAAQEG
ncbi:hypothetical protein Asi03nite_00160 [Actinoplanes siamensis]|uniref:Uncharacterized protein n=1 Tax=Actinoplanes siamensis TaxID=1223317 RepID=A0A919KBN8_9ACTN|nr:hypothetical protein Asi03nite_00160 [Actinoplanes siamensis]